MLHPPPCSLRAGAAPAAADISTTQAWQLPYPEHHSLQQHNTTGAAEQGPQEQLDDPR